MSHTEIIIEDKCIYDGPTRLIDKKVNESLISALLFCKRIEIVRTYGNGNRSIAIVEGESVTRRFIKQLNEEMQ